MSQQKHRFANYQELMATKVFVPGKGIVELGKTDREDMNAAEIFAAECSEAHREAVAALEAIARAMDEAHVKGEIGSRATTARLLKVNPAAEELVRRAELARRRCDWLDQMTIGEDPWVNDALEILAKMADAKEKQEER